MRSLPNYAFICAIDCYVLCMCDPMKTELRAVS